MLCLHFRDGIDELRPIRNPGSEPREKGRPDILSVPKRTLVMVISESGMISLFPDELEEEEVEASALLVAAFTRRTTVLPAGLLCALHGLSVRPPIPLKAPHDAAGAGVLPTLLLRSCTPSKIGCCNAIAIAMAITLLVYVFLPVHQICCSLRYAKRTRGVYVCVVWMRGGGSRRQG